MENESKISTRNDYSWTNIKAMLGIIYFLPVAWHISGNNFSIDLLRLTLIFMAFAMTFQAAWPFFLKSTNKLLSIKFLGLFCTLVGVALSLCIPPIAQVRSIYTIQNATRLPIKYFLHSQSFIAAIFIIVLWVFFFSMIIPLFSIYIINFNLLDKMIYDEQKFRSSFSIKGIFINPYPKTYITVAFVGLIILSYLFSDMLDSLLPTSNSLRSIISYMDLTWEISCDDSGIFPGSQINHNLFVIDNGSQFLIKKNCHRIAARE